MSLVGEASQDYFRIADHPGFSRPRWGITIGLGFWQGRRVELQRIPKLSISLLKLLVVVIFFVPLSARAAGGQSADAGSNCPGLKFDIAVPQDVIRPESAVLLDLKLTNVAHDAIWLPAGSPDFWSYDFELRDAQGTLVPRTAEWMRALSQLPTVTLHVNARIPLDAGASLTKTVMLEKLFDLSMPGQYTLRISFASFACGNSGTRVTSNLIHFTLGAPANRPSPSKARISVKASVTDAHLPSGWAAPLKSSILRAK